MDLRNFLSTNLRSQIDYAARNILLSAIFSFVLSLFIFHKHLRLLGAIYLLYFTLAFVLLVIVLNEILQRKLFQKRISPSKKAVLITGCDRGFGFGFAKRLGDAGFQVFAGCLYPFRDEALQLNTHPRIHCLQMDVTKPEEIQLSLEYANTHLRKNELWAVINNAGISKGSDIAVTSMQKIQEVLDVNLMGTVRVTKTFLPLLRQSKGRVINVASAAGRLLLPGFLPYSISKNAIIAFTDGLRMELRKFGVHVISIEPWTYRTNISDVSRISREIDKEWQSGSKEKCEHDQEHMKSLKKTAERIFSWGVSSNLDEVVDVVQEAVTHSQPRYSYSPGKWKLNNPVCFRSAWNMGRGERPTILQRAVRVTAQNYGVAAIFALTLPLLFVPWWIQWCLLYLCGIAFAVSVIAPFVDDWRPRARVPPQGKAVFISGCDSGFGHQLAQRLDGLGLHVFAGCLFPEKEGAQVLKKSCSERLHVLPLDVTSEESVENAVKYVDEHIGINKFWAVVNNAGLNAGAEMLWTSMDIMKHVFDVNTFGVMRLTKAFIPLLCRDKGRIVTVASAAGRYTYPGMVPYCMTKQATVSFCEGLRIEAYRFGVKVITIEPWMYKTPITQEDNILKYIVNAWEGTPEEIKELYPENYIERYKRSVLKFLKISMSDKPQEVVSCMEEAILALDPKYTYSPGTFYCRLMFWVLSRLPKPIADVLIHDECVVKFK